MCSGFGGDTCSLSAVVEFCGMEGVVFGVWWGTCIAYTRRT